jgi:hypothetical protein
MINNRHFSKNIIYFDANKLKEEKITFTYLTNYDSYLIKIGYIILILIILLSVGIASIILHHKTQSSIKTKITNFLAYTKHKLNYWRYNRLCVEKKNKYMKINFSDYYENN